MPGRYCGAEKGLFGFEPKCKPRQMINQKPARERTPDTPFTIGPSWEVRCPCGRVFLCIAQAEPKGSRCSVCMGSPGAFIPASASFDPFTGRYTFTKWKKSKS